VSKFKDLLSKWSKTVEESKVDNTMNVSSTGDVTITSTGSIKMTPAPAPTLTGAVLNTSIGANGTSYGTYGTMMSSHYVNPITYNVSFTMPNADIMNVKNLAGKEIVRMTQDGEVIWADPEKNIDEAAQALGQALTYSAELKAGITKQVKAKMRDTVFEEIIAIAEGKGALTADDLTYLYEASKIMEKLKGG
jgi:hypothetical protein